MRKLIALRVCGLAISVFSSVDFVASAANAGGLAVREQSTEFQGLSFAGDAAAGGGLSGMFWNPAVAAYAPKGFSAEVDGAAVFGNLEIKALPGTTGLGVNGLSPDTGNMERLALVPSAYLAYRLSPEAVIALSINSPFGLNTDPANRDWVGQTHNRLSRIKTSDVSPSIAFRLMPGLSIGAGVQIDHIESTFQNAISQALGAPDISVTGDDTAVGYTAGLNWNPAPQTSVGLGYRSEISHKLKGTISIPGSPNPAFAAGNPIATDVTLPDMITLSVRQGINDRLRVMGTVEWTHWSDLQKLQVDCPSLGLPFCTNQVANVVPLHWVDGWMFALGGEYDVSRQLKLRSGIAYELSPMQDPKNRTTGIPDQNRLSLSGGSTFAINDMISVDLAYSHFWGLGGITDRNKPPTLPLVPFFVRIVGDVDESADIVSASLKLKLGGP